MQRVSDLATADVASICFWQRWPNLVLTKFWGHIWHISA